MMFRGEVMLDMEGLPEVRASRTRDGHLLFRLHTVLSGGMSLFELVPDDVLRDARRADGDQEAFHDRLRAAAVAMVARLAAGDGARAARIEDLEEQLAATGVELAAQVKRVGELEAQLAAAQAPRPALKRPASRAA